MGLVPLRSRPDIIPISITVIGAICAAARSPAAAAAPLA